MIDQYLNKRQKSSSLATVVREYERDWSAEDLRSIAATLASEVRTFPKSSLIGIRTESAVNLLVALAAIEQAGGIPLISPASEQSGDAMQLDELELAATITDGLEPGELRIAHHNVVRYQPDLPSDSVVIFTSGTTGMSRPVVHTWKSLSSAVREVAKYQHKHWLCAYHARSFAALQVMLQALSTGGAIYLVTRGTQGLWRQLKHGEIDIASATPSFWRALLWESDGSRVERLQQLTLGGEVADQPLLESLRDTFPNARITHLYASTEMGVCFSVHDGKAGFPMSWLSHPPGQCEIAISDDGELLLRSRRRMVKALNRECDVSSASWFATGDLVQVSNERVLFAGRKTDVINVGGVKVHPLRIEEIIRYVPGVVDVCVHGIGSSITGQLPAARVQVSDDCDLESIRTCILKVCRQSLPKAMVPGRISLTVNPILCGDKLSRSIH